MYATGSFRDPAVFARFAEEFAAIEPPVVDDADEENLRDSKAPLVEIASMYAAKELSFDVERASKAANESKVDTSAIFAWAVLLALVDNEPLVSPVLAIAEPLVEFLEGRALELTPLPALWSWPQRRHGSRPVRSQHPHRNGTGPGAS